MTVYMKQRKHKDITIQTMHQPVKQIQNIQTKPQNGKIN